jgi:hypothetical protein
MRRHQPVLRPSRRRAIGASPSASLRPHGHQVTRALVPSRVPPPVVVATVPRVTPPRVEVNAVEAESKAVGRAAAMMSRSRGPTPSPVVVEGEVVTVPAPRPGLALHRCPFHVICA